MINFLNESKNYSQAELISKLSKQMPIGSFNLLTSQIQEMAQVDSLRKFANKLDVLA